MEKEANVLDVGVESIGDIYSVTGEKKDYRYLGELLERWQKDNISAKNVLSFLATHRELITVDNHSINSDQMDKFIDSMQSFLLQDDILYSAVNVGMYFYTILVLKPERLTECLEKYVQERGSIGCELGYLLSDNNREAVFLKQLTSKKSNIRKQIVKMLEEYRFDFNRNTKDTVEYFRQTIELIKFLKLSKNEFKNKKKFDSLKNILYLGKFKIHDISDAELVEIFKDCFLIPDYGFYLHRKLIKYCYSAKSKVRESVQSASCGLLRRNVYIDSDIFKQCYDKNLYAPIIFGERTDIVVNCHLKDEANKPVNEAGWSFKEISRTLDILKKYHVFPYRYLYSTKMIEAMDFPLIERLENDCYEFAIDCGQVHFYTNMIDDIFKYSEAYIYHTDFLTRIYERYLELDIDLRGKIKALFIIFGITNKNKQNSFDKYQDFSEIFDYDWDDSIIEKILQNPYLKEKYIMFLKVKENLKRIIYLKEKTIKHIFSFFSTREQNYLFVNVIKGLGVYEFQEKERLLKVLEFSDFKKPTSLVALFYLINDFDAFVTNEKIVKLALEEQTIIASHHKSIYQSFLGILSKKENLDRLYDLYGKQYIFDKISEMENIAVKMNCYLYFLNVIYCDEELMKHSGYDYQSFNDFIRDNEEICNLDVSSILSYHPILNDLRKQYLSGGSVIYENILNSSTYHWRYSFWDILKEIQNNQEKFSEQQMLSLKQKIIQRCFLGKTVDKAFASLAKCADTTIFSKEELCSIAKVVIYHNR